MGVDATTSAMVAAELLASDHFDAEGYVVGDPETLRGTLNSHPEDFPTLLALTDLQQGKTLSQIRILAANHEFYDDYAVRTQAFLEAYRE